VAWGVRGGLFFALVFCGLAALPMLFIMGLVLLTILSQRTGVATSFFVPETISLGLHALWVFPLYLAAGAVGGLIVGLLRPLTQWRLGTTIVGMIAGTIGYWCMGPVVAAFTDMRVLSMEHLLISLGLGSTVGGGVACMEWEPPEGKNLPNSRPAAERADAGDAGRA
jgi:hypothetical protein